MTQTVKTNFINEFEWGRSDKTAKTNRRVAIITQAAKTHLVQ